MSIFNNHKYLFGAALVLFIFLTFFAAIGPALQSQRDNAPLPSSSPLSREAQLGKAVFIAEGCVACHSQQVRNVEMDKAWGKRPSIAADYARLTRTDVWRNTASLMGSERTGPDLTDVGNRQSSADWHLLHLYNPRTVVPASVMPAYPWLFKEREYAYPEDLVVNVPDEFKSSIKGKIVAAQEAKYLVAYLQSLKQVPLPTGAPVPIFTYGKEKLSVPLAAGKGKASNELDGTALYASNCQSCHQENGLGLAGAFPPLKGSKIVQDKDPATLLGIIMKGYDGRVSEGYGIMPPVGKNNNLSPEEITAIMNHERTSWGNTGGRVTVAEVKKILASIK